MNRAKLKAVHPVLPSKNVQVAVEFYVKRLGFTPLFQDPSDPSGYVGIGRDGVELHIQWHDEAEWAAVERPSLRFLVDDVDALFEEWKGQGVFHENSALRETAWGTREFAFFDRDGNGLTFYRDL